MLAKMTSKNQITLPKAVILKLPSSEYYEVEAVNDCIMPTPVRVKNTDAVRRKLELLDITEQDVADAVEWARNNPDKPPNEQRAWSCLTGRFRQQCLTLSVDF